jgi:hypothetical protein
MPQLTETGVAGILGDASCNAVPEEWQHYSKLARICLPPFVASDLPQ